MAAPLILRAWMRAASCIVPPRERSSWHARWAGRAADWWLLAERGEPVGGAGPLLWLSLREAAHERFGQIRVRPLLRSPAVVAFAIIAAMLLVGTVSHGFAKTRAILSIAHDMRAHPAYCGPYDLRGDQVFAYLAPTILAWAVGIALLAMGCRALNGRGWRCRSFLAMKAAAVLVLATLAWVDVGAMARAPIHREGWRVFAGLVTMLVFVAGTGRAMLWAVADQRQRCPMCLRRLIAPVAIGSWASLFEPAATEFLCENGHGALAVADAEMNARDRWTRLDESWTALFR
jgi:hypothetical protein